MTWRRDIGLEKSGGELVAARRSRVEANHQCIGKVVEQDRHGIMGWRCEEEAMCQRDGEEAEWVVIEITVVGGRVTSGGW
jgi:hypothetical protein